MMVRKNKLKVYQVTQSLIEQVSVCHKGSSKNRPNTVFGIFGVFGVHIYLGALNMVN